MRVLCAALHAAVLAKKGTPHAYRNAGNVEAEYLPVMPPRMPR